MSSRGLYYLLRYLSLVASTDKVGHKAVWSERLIADWKSMIVMSKDL